MPDGHPAPDQFGLGRHPAAESRARRSRTDSSDFASIVAGRAAQSHRRPYHLPALTKPQTATYIDFQLKHAGGSEKIFESAVKELIHDYSGGIPRQVNNLATACLLKAATENSPRVSEAILQQTLGEFHLL